MIQACRLSRFYGGTPHEWLKQDAYYVSEVVKVMEALEAKEKLSDLTAHSFTSMKLPDRTKVRSNLERQASSIMERKAITPQDLSRLLGGPRG